MSKVVDRARRRRDAILELLKEEDREPTSAEEKELELISKEIDRVNGGFGFFGRLTK